MQRCVWVILTTCWCRVWVQSDELTGFLFHRWEAEDVGVRCSSGSLCAPHFHSVYDIPSLVSWWVWSPSFVTPLSFIKPLFIIFIPTLFELKHALPHVILSSFVLPGVRAAASVPGSSALWRPRSPTPTGRPCGWAGTRMRWFTSVPNAKSWLKPAVVNEDVEGSVPTGTPNTSPHSIKLLSLNFPESSGKVSNVLPDCLS